MRISVTIALTLYLSLFGSKALAGAIPVESAEFMVPSGESGISLFVRNKHPRDMTTFRPDNVLLYVHGGSTPAEADFDVQFGGISWMDFIAQHGYDVYFVDIRGYGHSTRPPEMDHPARENPPVARTQVAVRDIGSAVDFVKTRRHVAKLLLMGWSWGCAIMGSYAGDHNDSVEKLILYAPTWLEQPSAPITASQPPIGAYRTWSMESAKARWLTDVPEQQRESLIPPGWFDQFAAAALASDPKSSSLNPAAIRVPNGSAADYADGWSVGKPVYDPSKITVPTLIVHAEWDITNPAFMAQGVWKQLTRTSYKRYVEIGGGTHSIFKERNRMELFREVQLFLDDAFMPE